ncbi:MAG: endonuclease MutS2 [Clostridia bacterium]|nr:endonuclease MutS2 [Clostridia bacterium]
MEEKTLKTLEFDKICEILSELCINDDTKGLALNLLPRGDAIFVKKLLQDTDNAVISICKFGAPPISRVSPVNTSLKRMEVGGNLSAGELLNIAAILKCTQKLKKYAKNCENLPSDLFENLTECPDVEARISSAIISEDEISDNASIELSNIRRKIHRAGDKIKDTLNNMVRSPHYMKFLQDPIVTLRNDRYVVPVKAECRGDVPGIVHDMSASGGTLFVEPSGVVDANNELQELSVKEKNEIEKILAELTGLVSEIKDQIKCNYENIIEIDLIFAKAKLANRQKAIRPEINTEGKILIRNGRHPLIDPQKVVPQNITLGYDFDTLVVTGPNTGGKTVVLKTIGLFTLMAQSGLLIPASDGTVLSVFDGIFADIGDEQSIEQSLSTFSAHMKNIVHILGKFTRDSLVLFDELGAGTDPTEGAALANAILEYVKDIGAKTVATTHYSELKIYALTTDRVENASCEFDVNTLSPTYKLLIGIPGKSNAFAISKKLGLADFIIENSKQLLTKETVKFEDVLSNIEENRKTTETAKIKQERLKNEAAQLRAELKKERQALEEERTKILERANKKAEAILEKAKAETEKIVSSMRALQKEKDEREALKAMEEVRKELNIKIKSKKTKQNIPKQQNASKVNPNSFKPGMSVLIVDLNEKGTILSIDKKAGTAVIQMGIMKTGAKLSSLVILEDETKKNIMKFIPQKNVGGGIKSAKTEIDLRGMILEEAIMEADMFLDKAIMSGLGTVTLIHGKGTGVLRTGIQDMLRRHPHVKSFRNGKYGEGENGVTVVELKNS